MFKRFGFCISMFLGCLFIGWACEQPENQIVTPEVDPLRDYAAESKSEYRYEHYKTIDGAGYTTHILKMISGKWLTTEQVEDPEWWHWVKLVVPETVTSTTSLLFIGGGKRENKEPDDADDHIRELATRTQTIVIQLHNVPNQPVFFKGDKEQRGRFEDDLIAYGWRQFLEKGGDQEDVEWLPRLPMTRAAIRAMDAATSYASEALNQTLENFVVAGASKRGWTTWTTAVADDRVIAIAPIVIDLLNIVPSFQHHWQTYGEWSPAVEDYVREGVMDWMGSDEFSSLLAAVEPYSYLERLALPKMLINAAGDEFFLPDSWQFYWDDLQGEHHIRYVPNTGHSLDETDAIQTLLAFYQSIVLNLPRPDFQWQVVGDEIHLQTAPDSPPAEVRLWQALNEQARDFRIYVAGDAWTSTSVPLSEDGTYRLTVDPPENGWKGFFVELTFDGPQDIPFKLTTGIVVVPNTYPFPKFSPQVPKGRRSE